jgi:DnaK suppressor protein
MRPFLEAAWSQNIAPLATARPRGNAVTKRLLPEVIDVSPGMEIEPLRALDDNPNTGPNRRGRMLTETERQKIEKLLLEEREQAVESLEDFDQARAESLEEATGELTVYRFHLADIGTEAMEQEKQFLLASAEGRRLYEIDEALRKLYREPDKFGTCERCGKPIGMERLEVVPEAALCAACQRAAEA